MPISLQAASYFSLRAVEFTLHSPSFLRHSYEDQEERKDQAMNIHKD